MLTNDEFRDRAIRSGLERLESRLSAHIRNCVTMTKEELSEIENILLKLILDCSTLETNSVPQPNGIEDIPISLLGLCSGNLNSLLDNDHDFPNTLAALLFASIGNFITAQIFASKVNLDAPEIGPVESWAIQSLRGLRSLDRIKPPPPFERYVSSLVQAMKMGNPVYFRYAITFFHEYCSNNLRQHPREAMTLLLWEQIHQRFKQFSVARILEGRLPQEYIDAIMRTASPVFYPSQADAINNTDLLDPNKNVLISLPTSTGKSLLGELVLATSISNEYPLGIYLAPYRALADQIESRMKTRLHSIGIRCIIRRGGYLTETFTINPFEKTAIIATPEAIDSFLRREPNAFTQIACCVFDEFHLIEQMQRGLLYEGLIGRLLELKQRRGNLKIACLSPVVAVTDQLKRWLNVAEEGVVRSDWIPTTRRLAIAGPDRKILYFTPKRLLHLRKNK